jgi:hypothetical protein
MLLSLNQAESFFLRIFLRPEASLLPRIFRQPRAFLLPRKFRLPKIFLLPRKVLPLIQTGALVPMNLL